MAGGAAYEGLVSGVEDLYQTQVIRQRELERAGERLITKQNEARDTVFADLQDGDGAVRGVNIAELAEQEMRIAGVSRSNARRQAEELAGIFEPPADEQPLPYYFSQQGLHHRAACIAVANALDDEGRSAPLMFAATPRRPEYEMPGHNIEITSENSAGVFSRGYVTLGSDVSGRSVNWMVGNVGLPFLVDLANLRVIKDPEQISNGDRSSSEDQPTYIFAGEAAETAVMKDERRSSQWEMLPEAVALLTVLRHSQGMPPVHSFEAVEGRWRGGEDHLQETQAVIAHYVASLVSGHGARIHNSEFFMHELKGMPVQVHEAALRHQGAEGIGEAVLKGIGLGGGILPAELLETVSQRVISERKPYLKSSTIDKALVERVEELQVRLAEVNPQHGIHVDGPQLVELLGSDRELFWDAIVPKSGKELPENIWNVIRNHRTYSSRFKAADTDAA